MRDQQEGRAIELAQYMVENEATVRAAAARYGVSKSTVHKDVTVRLRDLDGSLYRQVERVLQKNKAERHLRGGNSTRLKYEREKRSETEAAVNA